MSRNQNDPGWVPSGESVSQNDPNELLEVFDADGRPTGRAKSRAAIHIDGDWHQAFHCWIVRADGREVVLQRRSLAKDTFGGCWDAAAAGHWRFGESAEQAAREISEELGFEVPFSELSYRGRERAARRFANGLIDREFHQVYLLPCDRPLSDYHPDPAEVAGVAAFDIHALLDLAVGRAATLRASEGAVVSRDGSLHPRELEVTRDDLVPYSVARYRRTLGLKRAR